MNTYLRCERGQRTRLRRVLTCLFCLLMVSSYPAAPSLAAHSGRLPQHITERVAISLTAAEALDALESGRMTSEQYVDILLRRIAEHPQVNAFVHVDPDQVRAAARLSDQQRTAGVSLGPLHGLPIVIKDSINTAEMPTTGGTPALDGFRPAQNAAVVQTLLDAGAIILGKTNLHELSSGYTTNNAFTGPTRNPYDFDRIPGGSSGGNGAALAARFTALAIGEDTAGSVRVPAALTGTLGFRPTSGRYSQVGVVPLSSTLDTIGPMARTVQDLALVDAIITGTPIGLESVSLKGIRIGVPRAYFWELLDPSVEHALNRVLRRLKSSGAILVQADIPDVGDLTQQASQALILFEWVRDLGNYLEDQGTGLSVSDVAAEVASPDVAFGLSLALSGVITEQDYLAVLDGLVPLLQQTYQSYLLSNDLDVVLYPTTPLPAPLIGEEIVTIDGVEFDVLEAYFRFPHYTPVIGAPTLSLPIGQDPRGLPLGGIDIAGAPGDDRKVLAIGQALAKVLPRIRPPRTIKPLPRPSH